MSRSGALLRADLRRIAREPMLVFLAALPVALALALRAVVIAGPPSVAEALVDHWRASVAVLVLTTPMMLGFVYGLVVLDERDEGVLLAVAVTPVGKRGFLLHRLVIPALWSGAATAAVLPLSGLPGVDPTRTAALTLLAALEAPLLALFIGAFAGNKVEGMALSKVGSVLIGVGALLVLAPAPWEWAGVVSPHYWLVRIVAAGGPLLAMGGVGVLLAVAVPVHLAALWLLARAFERRVG